MDERLARWERRFEIPVLVAAVLVVPIIAIEQTTKDARWRDAATAANWATWLVFTSEVITLTLVAGDRRRWLASHPLDLAIVLLTPPFLPSSLQALRAFRVLRLLRLVRAAQIARRLLTLEGIRWAAVLALLTALGGGALFSAAEGREVSTWDGVWWSVSTMTTVGYGDLYPHTTAGRVVAMSLMFVGIGFVAILTAALAERFVSQDIRTEARLAEQMISDEVALAETDLAEEIRDVRDRLQSLEARLAARR